MDIGGLTALHCAAGMGHTNVVRVLVSANATVDVKASGVVNWVDETPLLLYATHSSDQNVLVLW